MIINLKLIIIIIINLYIIKYIFLTKLILYINIIVLSSKLKQYNNPLRTKYYILYFNMFVELADFYNNKDRNIINDYYNIFYFRSY